MSIKRHGLSIGLERVDDDFFLILKPVGKLTHADYEIINPMIDDALKGLDKPPVRALVDASEFDGWELRAAWDDFRLGLKHGNAFEKLAIVGERKWEERMASIADWFMCAKVQYFGEVDAALSWLHE